MTLEPLVDVDVDFWIQSATPVQSALEFGELHPLPDINMSGEGDLVLGKDTAFIVKVMADKEPPSAVRGVEVSVDFQGEKLRSVVPRGSFTAAGDKWGAEVILKTLIPRTTGPGQRVHYAVRPQPSGVRESNSNNNELEESVEVKETHPLLLAFVPIPDCQGLPGQSSCYADLLGFQSGVRDTIEQGTEFVKATYPVATVVGMQMPDHYGNQSRTPDGILTRGVLRDLDFLELGAAVAAPDSMKTIGVVPAFSCPPGEHCNDYFGYHGLEDVAGAARADAVTYPYGRAALVAAGRAKTVAHELGHLLGVHPSTTTSTGEEYIRDPNTKEVIYEGNPAYGYYVATGARTDEKTLCFMSASRSSIPKLGRDGRPPDYWIDTEHWTQLFQNLLVSDEDPEVLVVSATLRKNGTADLKSWYALPAGVPDASVPGEAKGVQVRVFSASGQLLTTFSRPVLFSVFVDPVGSFPVDSVPFVARVEFPKNAASVEIVRDNVVVARASPVTKVLRDNIVAIPATGFRHGPGKNFRVNRREPKLDARRKALLDKMDAFEMQLAGGSYTEALDTLAKLREQVVMFLTDGHRAASPLEPTKEQLLKVIDMMIERVSNMMSG